MKAEVITAVLIFSLGLTLLTMGMMYILILIDRMIGYTPMVLTAFVMVIFCFWVSVLLVIGRKLDEQDDD